MEKISENNWCHYSDLPSPDAYIQTHLIIYDTQRKEYRFHDYPEFLPSYSPIEMFNLGVFGGNYFGNRKVNKKWEEFVPEKFLKECQEIAPEKIFNNLYSVIINKYGVICGMNYDKWIKSEWIIEQDPYGWFNWYINFFYGRRSDDDNRQIKRWKSFTSRHSAMLKGHCKKAEKDLKDESFGLKIRQGLLHWAYNIL